MCHLSVIPYDVCTWSIGSRDVQTEAAFMKLTYVDKCSVSDSQREHFRLAT